MPASERGAASVGLAGVLALAVAHAALFDLAFAVPALGALIALAPVPLAVLATRARRAALLLVVPVVQVPTWLHLNAWMADVTRPGYLGQALVLAAMTWLVALALRRLGRRGWSPLLSVPLVLVAADVFRAHLLVGGYPWFLLAHPLGRWPIAIQTADLLGTHLVSALVALVAGGLVAAADAPTVRARCLALGTPALAWALALAYGAWQLGRTDGPGADAPRLLALQTNLPQDVKLGWTLEDQVRDFGAFVDGTVRAVDAARSNGRAPDLVAWPETMLPGFGFDAPTLDWLREHGYGMPVAFAEAALQLQSRLGVPMILGSIALENVGVSDGRWTFDRQFNAAYLAVDGAAMARYDKIALTPFGERIPGAWRWPALQQWVLDLGADGMRFDLAPGDAPRTLDVPWRGGTLPVAVPICFESTVPGLCRTLVWQDGRRAADLLLNLSNDGWFGDDDRARRQFVDICRFRCVENRTPLARAANTGLSVAIDAAGNVYAAAGPGRYGASRSAGALLAEIPLDDRRPLYARVGDAGGWLALLGALVALAAPRRGAPTNAANP